MLFIDLKTLFRQKLLQIIKIANKWHKFQFFLEWIIHMHVIIYDKGLIKAGAVDKCAVQWVLVSKGKVKGSRWCLESLYKQNCF